MNDLNAIMKEIWEWSAGTTFPNEPIPEYVAESLPWQWKRLRDRIEVAVVGGGDLNAEITEFVEKHHIDVKFTWAILKGNHETECQFERREEGYSYVYELGYGPDALTAFHAARAEFEEKEGKK